MYSVVWFFYFILIIGYFYKIFKIDIRINENINKIVVNGKNNVKFVCLFFK